MNKENALFTVCGFLLGLIAGSLMLGPAFYERRIASSTTRVAGAPPEARGAATPTPAAGGADAGGNPAVMEMVRQRIAELRAALERNPDDVDALVQLGNLYMDAAKYREAIPFYERALRVRYNSDVATDLGISLRETGAREQALEVFRSISRQDPKQWHAGFNEAVVLVELKRYDEARRTIERLRKLRPEDPDLKRFEETLAALQ